MVPLAHNSVTFVFRAELRSGSVGGPTMPFPRLEYRCADPIVDGALSPQLCNLCLQGRAAVWLSGAIDARMLIGEEITNGEVGRTFTSGHQGKLRPLTFQTHPLLSVVILGMDCVIGT